MERAWYWMQFGLYTRAAVKILRPAFAEGKVTPELVASVIEEPLEAFENATGLKFPPALVERVTRAAVKAWREWKKADEATEKGGADHAL
jgi:hypothetical protein